MALSGALARLQTLLYQLVLLRLKAPLPNVQLYAFYMFVRVSIGNYTVCQ